MLELGDREAERKGRFCGYILRGSVRVILGIQVREEMTAASVSMGVVSRIKS